MPCFKTRVRRYQRDQSSGGFSTERPIVPGPACRGFWMAPLAFLLLLSLFFTPASLRATETPSTLLSTDWQQRNPFIAGDTIPPFAPSPIDISLLTELATQATEVGLHALAAQLFRSALEDEDLSPDLRAEAQIGLATTQVALFRPLEALAVLNEMDMPGSRETLIRIIAHLQANESDRARELLTDLDRSTVDPSQRVWLAIAEAYLLSRSGDTVAALEVFEYARRATTLPHLQRQIELASLTESLRVEDASESLAVQLRRQMESATRPEVRLRLLREYALTLAALNRQEDAIEIITAEMRGWSAESPALREELLFIVGLLTRAETDEGRSALRELLSTGSDRELLSAGLGLLVQVVGDSSDDELTDFLSKLIEEQPGHPLADEMLFLLARLAVTRGEIDGARERLDVLDESFPGSDIIPYSLRLRAYLAWRQSPPRLRIAATHLLDSIQLSDNSATRSRLLALAGDLYLVNRDYSNAASLYEQAFALAETRKSSVFFRKVHTLILNQQSNRAQEVIDNARTWLRDEPDLRWMLEWSLLSHLRSTGGIEIAQSRIHALLDEARNGMAPTSRALYFRIRWLDASLRAEVGAMDEALSDLKFLMDEVGIDTNLTPSERDLLWSQSALLKGQILLRHERETEAAEMFHRLRQRLPDTRASVLSILIEARHFAARDMTIEAQQRLVSLADEFPESEYAVQALFEAAEVALSRGTDSSIDNALKFLDLISQRYPDDPVRVRARIRQAEILTERQQSAAARSIYDNLLRSFPDHQLRPIIEVRLADASAANPNASADQLESALAVYRRLSETPQATPGLRAEALYKAANLLTRMKRSEEAIVLLWTLVERVREEPIRGDARYWSVRALFDLGQWLEDRQMERDAGALYQLVIDFQLPGTALAEARLRRLETAGSRSP